MSAYATSKIGGDFMSQHDPPHSIESEEAVIAAFLIDANECGTEGIAAILDPRDFYREHLGWVYTLCLVTAQPDAATLAAQLSTIHDWAPDIGWGGYLMGIEGRYFTAIGVEAHARYVARLAFSRRLLEAAATVARISADVETTARVQLDDVAGILESLRGHARRASALPAEPFFARRGEMP